jgi:hypothetical protein
MLLSSDEASHIDMSSGDTLSDLLYTTILF